MENQQNNPGQLRYLNFETILSSSQSWLQKTYISQHCLLVMIEKIKEAVNNSNEFVALLIDLSKAFPCIDHSLLLAKLYGYGLSCTLLKLMIFSYFESQTQRPKVSKCFSKSSKIDYGVPQS